MPQTRDQKLAIFGGRATPLALKKKAVATAISDCLSGDTSSDWSALQGALVTAYSDLGTEVNWGVLSSPLLNDDSKTLTDPPA